MKSRKISMTCLSDLEIDEMLAGELQDSQRKRCEQHLKSCHGCMNRQTELERSAQELSARIPTWQTIAQQNSPKPSLRTSWLRYLRPAFAFGGPLLVAAAVLLFWNTRDDSSSQDGYRSKGGPSLGYYIKTAEGAIVGGQDEKLRANDSVRFSYTSAHDAYLLILSRDSTKQISVYHANQELAAYVASGSDDLDGSVILDDVLGLESIYGFFCSKAARVDDAVGAITSSPGSPTLDSCQVARLHWTKVP